MMKSILRLLLFCTIFSSTFLAAFKIQEIQTKPPLSNNEKEETIIHWAQNHLPQSGVLTENNDGFVYLKVDDDYINQLFPLLDNPAYVKPPYFRRLDSPGAHISVFYVDERKQTGKIKEIGQKYSFKIKSIAYVPPKRPEYIVLELDSKELEALREKYGLSPHLKGHDFHITIAKKKNKHDKMRHRSETEPNNPFSGFFESLRKWIW